MGSFNLKAISQALLDRLNPNKVRKNGQLQTDPNATTGYMDPFAPNEAQPIAQPYRTPKPIQFKANRPDPAELASAQAMQSRGLDLLGQGPAKVSGPKVDPTESLVGSLFGLLVKNPGASAKAFAAPERFAAQRAEVENANNQNAFAYNQNYGNALLNTSQRVISEWYDRDSAADKIEADVRKAEMAGAVKEFTAKAKFDQLLMTSLAKVLDEGGSLPAIKTLIEQRNFSMGVIEQDDEVEAKAQELYNAAQSDPSFKSRLNMFKAQTAQQETERRGVKDARDLILNKNATFESKLSAIMDLAERQIMPFANMTFKEMQEAASVKGAETVKLEADTAKAQAATERDKAETARTKILSKFLPQEKAASLAKIYADIDNMKSDNAREDAKSKTDKYKAILTSLQGEYGSLTNNIGSLRASRREWEKKLAEIGPRTDANAKEYDEANQQVKEYDDAIGGKLKQLKGISSEANKIRDNLGVTQESSPEPDPVDTFERTTKIRKDIAASKDKKRANAALRAIDAGADPEEVYRRFKGN